jgi:predicted phosphodiesterase
MARTMVLAGHTLALVHGHGKIHHYLLNKIKMVLSGYDLANFLPAIRDSIPETEIIVFGHTHRPVNMWYDQNQLLFNPGSSCIAQEPYDFPSLGIIYLEMGKQPEGKIVALEGEKLVNRHWEKQESILKSS